jgi:hypothetical protein
VSSNQISYSGDWKPVWVNGESYLASGDRRIHHDDFLREIATMFFLLPREFRGVAQCFGKFYMPDLLQPRKHRSVDFLVERYDNGSDILGECKTEIIDSDIILETLFGRHYRKIYEKMVGRKADIWYVSPLPPSKKTLKVLNDINHELDRKDRIHTYNNLVKSVVKKLEIWGKNSGKIAESRHAKLEIERKCQLLLNF